MGLWNDLTDRISSIYLPDKKRPMLPAGLSESICSLVTDSKSIVFAMDITLDTDYNIISIEFNNCVISVKNNYTYESDILYKDPLYHELKKCSSRMLDKYPYLDSIEDSHDVVAYFMILMNHQCGKQLALQNTGIFRNATLTSNILLVSRMSSDNLSALLETLFFIISGLLPFRISSVGIMSRAYVFVL